ETRLFGCRDDRPQALAVVRQPLELEPAFSFGPILMRERQKSAQILVAPRVLHQKHETRHRIGYCQGQLRSDNQRLAELARSGEGPNGTIQTITITQRQRRQPQLMSSLHELLGARGSLEQRKTGARQQLGEHGTFQSMMA